MRFRVRPQDLAEVTNAYENRLFGPDFEATPDQIAHWLRSPMFFWAVAIDDRGPPDVGSVLGTLSILVTTVHSFEQLVRGHIRENDLQPWYAASSDIPIAYFCSYTLRKAGAGAYLFKLAGNYLSALKTEHDIELGGVFSIGATPAGARHLCRSGIDRSAGTYAGRYPILEGRHDSALSNFWQKLLRRPAPVRKRSIPTEGRLEGLQAA